MQPNLLRNRCFLPTKNTKYRTFYRTHFLLISLTCLSRYISLSFYRPALLFSTSAVKRLIAINLIRFFFFCLHNICVYLLCLYKYTFIYLRKISYVCICMSVYLYRHNKDTQYRHIYYVNKNLFWMRLIIWQHYLVHFIFNSLFVFSVYIGAMIMRRLFGLNLDKSTKSCIANKCNQTVTAVY